MAVEEKDEKEFTISDRRSASPEETASPEKEDTKKQPDTTGQKPADAAEQQEKKDTPPLPEIDFATFILSLATSAQVHFGSAPHPQTGVSDQNLPAAKQMIDILGILKEKTRGNLSKEEEMLLDSALYNLRMQYIHAVEGKK